ncbi:MAG: methyltransferase domain-containing protein [Chloroflexi bacterium]|nr:MAG: methyltransferase domain-containing protein [Chloroflexota bacterium]
MGNDRVDYDDLWRDTWGDMQQVGPVHRHIQDDLVRVVTSLDVRSVLDVGCGSGENLARLAALGRFDLAGTDVSEEALALARRRAPSVKFSVLDIEREALAESFDLVMNIQVVEHLSADVAALRNMAAMTRKYVFTSTMAGRMRPSERFIGHVRNYSAAELRRKLVDAGLDVVWVRGWGFPLYSPLYRTLVEFLPAGPPKGRVGPMGRVLAAVLYQVYRLNVPGRGDVLSALARVRTG